jgi:cation transport regulator
MPYRSNKQLPDRVRTHLDEHAQDIYREAFNNAWTQYTKDPRQEEIAHRVAWSAVKKQYEKIGSAWVHR